MTRPDNAAALELARQGAQIVKDSIDYFAVRGTQSGEKVATCLFAFVEQFNRLDKKERRQIAAGKTGGRPRHKKPSKAAAAKRAQRARKHGNDTETKSKTG